MRKKVLSIILGMAMLSGVLAGCGSNGGDTVQNNTAAESEASAETVDPDTENTETESEETQYPITISHAYGETVIESKPERIVTLGWGNQDTVLALGVVPVGVSAANYGYVTEHGLHEWTDEAFASLGESNPNVFDDTDGFDYEAISDAAPDVILAAYSGMTEEEYETLSAIAPVVPSSDTATHLEIYKAFPKIGGIVHTHSPWATSWAQAGRGIPCYGTTHADYLYGEVPCVRNLTEKEINEAYEKNTGVLIADEFDRPGLDYIATPAVLCKNHGPFTWGKDAHEAVHNAVVLEEVAKMAARCEMINPDVKPAPQELQDKHYFRKHGANAYYGQPGK